MFYMSSSSHIHGHFALARSLLRLYTRLVMQSESLGIVKQVRYEQAGYLHRCVVKRL